MPRTIAPLAQGRQLVLWGAEHAQVLDAVVVAPGVDVVHVLVGQQPSPEMALHDGPVLQHPATTGRRHGHVAPRVRSASAAAGLRAVRAALPLRRLESATAAWADEPLRPALPIRATLPGRRPSCAGARAEAGAPRHPRRIDHEEAAAEAARHVDHPPRRLDPTAGAAWRRAELALTDAQLVRVAEEGRAATGAWACDRGRT